MKEFGLATSLKQFFFHLLNIPNWVFTLTPVRSLIWPEVILTLSSLVMEPYLRKTTKYCKSMVCYYINFSLGILSFGGCGSFTLMCSSR